MDSRRVAESAVEYVGVFEGRGRLITNEFLEVEGWPGVWALGDCAAVPDSSTGKSSPPTAQHALRQGKVVAGNVVAAMAGGRRRPFRFKTIGALASIGKRTGVARIFGVNFSGVRGLVVMANDLSK